MFVRNDAEGGSLCHKIDEELTLSRAQTLHHNGETNLYASPPESAATDLIYARRAIQAHSDNKICVTPQSEYRFAPQTEFANLVPSGTHYCSQISIAGAYEAFEGGDDDTITTSADRDRHQLDREKREGEKDIEEKKNKSTGSEKTDRQIERAGAPRAPSHSYLYDGAPAERNIINMASATEAMDISKTAPVPHNTVTFSAPI